MPRRHWIVSLKSERRPHKEVRRLARRLLRRGVEPQPRYRTGKFWTD